VTLPVSIRAAEQRLGISNQVASFVLPTGTTLNKNGAAVYKAVTAVFLAHLYGLDLDAGRILTILLTTIVASSAGAGVPGSSLVTTMIVLNAIGLGRERVGGHRTRRGHRSAAGHVQDVRKYIQQSRRRRCRGTR
jgi:Na+/H+-dicarboxylate symporter